MDLQQEKCELVVIYNHNFKANIEKIRRIYRDRFSSITQIVPYYYDKDIDVIPVHGSSFTFQSYIAQARTALLAIECDRYLFIGDDLILNPSINELNVCQQLALTTGALYLDGFIDVASGLNGRAAYESHNFDISPKGFNDQENNFLPSYDEALKKLLSQGRISSSIVAKYKPYFYSWVRPIPQHALENLFILKNRLTHIFRFLSYRLCPRRMSYPCVFGYSDIISVPKWRFLEWCHYLELFATWGMFVELAIPTSFSLMPDAHVTTIGHTGFKSGNLWFPQGEEHHANIEAVINKLIVDTRCCIDSISTHFPREFLYLHPVKLSKFT